VSAAAVPLPFAERRRRPRGNRELYIDAFRGVMALVMVQGHVFDALVREDLRATPGYQFEAMFHGSTAPGFLFASGFVAGLPRAPLSPRASVRRARRLLFVLAVGYALHLPYFSAWKVALSATPAERAALFACDALQLIAVSQLGLLVLQWMAGARWVRWAAVLAVAILAAGPFVWASSLSAALPLPLAAYLDMQRAPSRFPLFPFAAFVLAGTVAGAVLGRQMPEVRRRRALVAGASLVGAGLVLAIPLSGRVDFWGVSPAYALVRLGALVLLMLLVERLVRGGGPLSHALALVGHETLLVYVLHLVILFGSVVTGASAMLELHGRLTFAQAAAVLLRLAAALYVAAWVWHRVKVKAPHAAHLVLVFLGIAFTYEVLTRPW
jgi:uncharacterized membrane protein